MLSAVMQQFDLSSLSNNGLVRFLGSKLTLPPFFNHCGMLRLFRIRCFNGKHQWISIVKRFVVTYEKRFYRLLQTNLQWFLEDFPSKVKAYLIFPLWWQRLIKEFDIEADQKRLCREQGRKPRKYYQEDYVPIQVAAYACSFLSKQVFDVLDVARVRLKRCLFVKFGYYCIPWDAHRVKLGTEAVALQ